MCALRSVNKVVPHDEVLPTAIAWARSITENSPDAVAATKRTIILAHQLGNFEHATIAGVNSQESRRVYTGENIKASLPYPSIFFHFHFSGALSVMSKPFPFLEATSNDMIGDIITLLIISGTFDRKGLEHSQR